MKGFSETTALGTVLGLLISSLSAYGDVYVLSQFRNCLATFHEDTGGAIGCEGGFDQCNNTTLGEMAFYDGPEGPSFVTASQMNHGNIFTFDIGTETCEILIPGNNNLGHAPGLAISPHSGNLLVVHRNIDSISTWDPDTGEYLGLFSTLPSESEPYQCVFGPDGNLYVSCPGRNTVCRIDGMTGKFLDDFATDSATIELDGLAFAFGDLFVCSRGTNEVFRFRGSDGSSKGSFVGPGSGESTLSSPIDLTFAEDGTLYVTSYGNDRVQVYQCDCNGAAYLRTLASSELDGPLDVELFPQQSPPPPCCTSLVNLKCKYKQSCTGIGAKVSVTDSLGNPVGAGWRTTFRVTNTRTGESIDMSKNTKRSGVAKIKACDLTCGDTYEVEVVSIENNEGQSQDICDEPVVCRQIVACF